MGYKLAGFDVIGHNDIDKKMIEVYKKNHNWHECSARHDCSNIYTNL